MIINKFWKLYPTNKKRLKISNQRTKVSLRKRLELQKFNREYFDGDRRYGYGGYYYDKKFFRKIVKEIIKHYKLNNNSRILDIGCAKGFMLYEFKHFLPGCKITGIDISKYAKKHSKENIKKFIKIASCDKLPLKSNYYDFIISISTIHNLPKNKISNAIKEIERVKKKSGKSFIRIKGYNNSKEKKFIDDWNLVAKSNLSVKEWLKIFKKFKYSGDYEFAKF